MIASCSIIASLNAVECIETHGKNGSLEIIIYQRKGERWCRWHFDILLGLELVGWGLGIHEGRSLDGFGLKNSSLLYFLIFWIKEF